MLQNKKYRISAKSLKLGYFHKTYNCGRINNSFLYHINNCLKGETDMDLIPSFSVDHTRIIPGIFTSRVDVLGDQKVTTYDVRVTRPNIEPAVDVAAMHSLSQK